MTDTIEVTESNFEELVVEASRAVPVLVDISADWCAPCRALAPLLNQAVEAARGRVRLAIVDADENMKIAGRHKVRGFPTVVAYSHGVEVARFHSAQTLGFLTSFIEEVLAAHRRGAAGVAG